jgi:hypothetical protein
MLNHKDNKSQVSTAPGVQYELHDIDDTEWYFPSGYVQDFVESIKGNPDYKHWYSKKDTLRLTAKYLTEQSIDDETEVEPELIERIVSAYSNIHDIEPTEKVYGKINKLRNSITRFLKLSVADLEQEEQRNVYRNRELIRDILLVLEPDFRELVGSPLPEIGQNESFRLMPKKFQQKLVISLNGLVNELREDMGVSSDDLYEELKISPWNVPRPSTVKIEEPPRVKEKYTRITGDFINENMGLIHRARICPAKEALADLFNNNGPGELDVMEQYGYSEQDTVSATQGKNMIDAVLLNLVDRHSVVQQVKYRDSKIQWFKNIFDTNQSGPAKVLAKFYGQMSGIKLFKLESTEEVLENFGMRKETQDSLERTDVYLLKFNTKSTGKKQVSHLVPVCIASAPPSSEGAPIKVRQYALSAKSEYMMELAQEISKNQAILAREVIPIFRG